MWTSKTTLPLALIVWLLLALAAAVRAQQPVTVQGVATDRCADPTKILTWGLNYPPDVGRVELVPADAGKRFYLCSGRVQTSDAHPGLVLQLGTGTTCLTAPLTVDRLVFTAGGEVHPLSAGSLSGTFAIGAVSAALCADRGATSTWIHGYIRYVQE